MIRKAFIATKGFLHEDPGCPQVAIAHLYRRNGAFCTRISIEDDQGRKKKGGFDVFESENPTQEHRGWCGHRRAA